MKEISSKIHGFGKALMMPISVIAAAGIFLGLAAAMQNPAVTGEAFAQLKYPQWVIGFIRQVASALFANLPLFFAVASAIGLAREEKPTAAFAAVIGFIGGPDRARHVADRGADVCRAVHPHAGYFFL